MRQNLPVPPADYLAETPEERLVMYADKFHSKSHPGRFLSPANTPPTSAASARTR